MKNSGSRAREEHLPEPEAPKAGFKLASRKNHYFGFSGEAGVEPSDGREPSVRQAQALSALKSVLFPDSHQGFNPFGPLRLFWIEILARRFNPFTPLRTVWIKKKQATAPARNTPPSRKPLRLDLNWHPERTIISVFPARRGWSQATAGSRHSGKPRRPRPPVTRNSKKHCWGKNRKQR